MGQIDYIFREIGRLQAVFAKILNLTRIGNHEEADEIIKVVLKSLSGLNIELFAAFRTEDLLKMMRGYDEDITKNKKKLVSVSRLLHEHGNIETEKNKALGTAFFQQSLQILVHALGIEQKALNKTEKAMLDKYLGKLEASAITDKTRAEIQNILSRKPGIKK